MPDVTGWRLVKDKHAGTAFSGEGARIFGGRWNSPGVRVIYCSEQLSLATLEILVHTLPVRLKDKFRAFRIRFDEALLVSLTQTRLPNGWDAQPPTAASQAIGDEWIKSARSLALAVPSVLVPLERTFLINPVHSDFAKLKIKDMGRFLLDPRLKS
jgi:RES domain-containing protein